MRTERSDWIPPVLVFLLLFGLAIVGIKGDIAAVEQRERATSDVLVSFAARHLTDHLEERSRVLEPLIQARESGRLTTSADFQNRAADLLAAFPDITLVALCDARGRVLWSHGDSRPDAFAGTDLSAHEGRREAMAAAAKSRSTTLSPLFTTLDGKLGAALYAPVFRKGVLDGFVYAAIAADEIIDSSLPPRYLPDHRVLIRLAGGQTLYGRGPVGKSGAGRIVTVLGRQIEVHVWPARPEVISFGSTELNRFLIYLLAAGLISAMLRVALYERRVALAQVDERRQVTDSLRASQERLADIVARSPWAVLEHDTRGVIQNVNPAAERIFKLKREEMIGRHPQEWLHPDDADSAPQLVFPKTDVQSALQTRIIDAQGAVRHVRWTRVRRMDEQRHLTGSIVFGQDVTAEVEAAEAREKLLMEEERLIERLWVLNDFARSLRTTLDAQSLYQIAIGAASNVLAQRACAILTWNREEEFFEVRAVRTASPESAPTLPLRPGTLIPADTTDLTLCARECRQLVTDDLAASPGEHEEALVRAGFVSRAAVPILMETTCVGLLVAYSAQKGIHSRDNLEFMQGIAEHLALALTSSRLFAQLKESYNQLRQMQSQIVQMEKLRAVGVMASGIAHNFNNLLLAILGSAELLDGPELDEEQREYVSQIIKAANDAAAVVRRIQDYSRRVPAAESDVLLQPNALLEEAIHLTRHKWRDQAQNRGIEIKLEQRLEPDLPLIRGSANELREVLTNLLFNAVDAMPDGGVITVSSARRGQRVFLSVSDTGTGMSPEVQERIFESFFTTKGRQGNGLGLAISLGIARRHGGDIEVRSAPGKGSRFTVVLPVAEEQEAELPQQTITGDLQPAAVLVIDDDPQVSAVVTAMLEKLGNRVVSASSGLEGLQRLKDGRFDVLFTDLGMPGMSGRDVAVSAKQLAPEMPVVLLTGWGDQIRAEEERPEAVDLVLGKPVRLEQLRDALRHLTQNGGPA